MIVAGIDTGAGPDWPMFPIRDADVTGLAARIDTAGPDLIGSHDDITTSFS